MLYVQERRLGVSLTRVSLVSVSPACSRTPGVAGRSPTLWLSSLQMFPRSAVYTLGSWRRPGRNIFAERAGNLTGHCEHSSERPTHASHQPAAASRGPKEAPRVRQWDRMRALPV